jgi:hypothetical protein
MFKKVMQRIKDDKALFRFLANKLYKFFNIIERGDLITTGWGFDQKKIFRVLDMFNDGSIDCLCDHDPQPMRTRFYSDQNLKLYNKFFKGKEFLRDVKQDNGWRLFGPGAFYNFKLKEVLLMDKKHVPYRPGIKRGK